MSKDTPREKKNEEPQPKCISMKDVLDEKGEFSRFLNLCDHAEFLFLEADIEARIEEAVHGHQPILKEGEGRFYYRCLEAMREIIDNLKVRLGEFDKEHPELYYWIETIKEILSDLKDATYWAQYVLEELEELNHPTALEELKRKRKLKERIRSITDMARRAHEKICLRRFIH